MAIDRDARAQCNQYQGHGSHRHARGAGISGGLWGSQVGRGTGHVVPSARWHETGTNALGPRPSNRCPSRESRLFPGTMMLIFDLTPRGESFQPTIPTFAPRLLISFPPAAARRFARWTSATGRPS